MAKLPFRLKLNLEKLLQMEQGYILDFSNSKFAYFISEVANIDIYKGEGYEEYQSKANKLRKLIARENDFVVGTVLYELLMYANQYLKENNHFDEGDEDKLKELLEYSKGLIDSNPAIQLPKVEEEDLQTLLDDINASLAKNQPALVLDRLHTFSTKFLRQICQQNGIEIADNNGKFYPLHSLAGMLKNYYANENKFQSEFTITAIQNNIQLFDKYNTIRNDNSYAHDNEILNNIEAEFAIRAMANVLSFIDKIERVNQSEDEESVNNNDLPF